MGITIIGLGPGDYNLITLEAREVLNQSSEVWVRTVHHPTVGSLLGALDIHSFDAWYEQKPSFAEVYEAVATEVVRLGQRPQGVVYAVPGHPLVGEASVLRVLQLAREKGLGVRIVPGLSFVEPVCTLLGVDPLENGLQVLDAMTLEPRSAFDPVPPFAPLRPLLISQLYSRRVASMVKLSLVDFYPDDHLVVLVSRAGVAGHESVHRVRLYELDRQDDIGHLTSLYVPPLEAMKGLRTFSAIAHIVARLRAPGGCPWDREQSHQTLTRNLLQESYEVLEALDTGDMAKLEEELGDLLMQVVLHAQIAAEEGEFTIADVIQGISEKLIRRHPHVFADVGVKDSSEVLRNWERIKKGERENNGLEEKGDSFLSSIPKQLPALAYSQDMQARVARVGFDWKDVEGVLSDVADELRELARTTNHKEEQHELGDVLFALVNVARWLGLDAEECLRLANRRFYERFTRMEQLCRERGLDFSELSFEQQNALWDEVKKLEAGS